MSHVSRVACLVRVCGGVGTGVSCCPRGGAVVDLAAEVVLVCLQRLDLLPQLRDLGVQQLLVIRQLDLYNRIRHQDTSGNLPSKCLHLAQQLFEEEALPHLLVVGVKIYTT